MHMQTQTPVSKSRNAERGIQEQHTVLLGVVFFTSSTLKNSVRRPADVIRRKNHRTEVVDWTYHWLDIRMRDGVELVVLELQFGTNVDICSLILGRVAIFWCRKDCYMVSNVGKYRGGLHLLHISLHAPPHTPPF